jgi:sulfate transport system substrate-binding protein
VADGLEASVVTMNQANDIDMLADRGLVSKRQGLGQEIPEQWRAPYYSTMVFLVRKGNPKADQELGRPGQAGREGHHPESQDRRQRPLHLPGGLGLGAEERRQRSAGARPGRQDLQERAGAGRRRPRRHHHLHPAPDRRRPGDLRERSEMVRAEFGDNFEVVYPSVSILAESPVAVVDKVVDRKGVRKQATAYLNFLYTEPARKSAPSTSCACARKT